MRCVNLHLRIKEILSKSFQFDGSQYDPNLQTVLAIQNRQHWENKFYQQYNVKITRAFHNQAMMKHKIYKNTLARRSWMDYSPGICFQTSLVKMNRIKALIKSNQLGKTNQKQGRRCRCGSINYIQITSNDCPVGIYYQKTKQNGLGNGDISIQDK